MPSLEKKRHLPNSYMASRDEVASRRTDVQRRIRIALNAAKAEERASVKG